mgnify:CR=1 FL=1|nr:MAG TPA: hypothetical protein [Caudoviricetes sp.]
MKHMLGDNFIESKKILYSKGKNDECMTPSYGVEPILKYIPQNAIVWCDKSLNLLKTFQV